MSAQQQQLFSALAEPSRRKMLEMLAARGEMSASEICDEFEVTPQDISRHLRVLRESGLVIVERRAQQRIYRVNAETILLLEDWARQMAQRLDALDAVIKKTKRRK
jgi:DNA-binding transcriptional ArsR family regulator